MPTRREFISKVGASVAGILAISKVARAGFGSFAHGGGPRAAIGAPLLLYTSHTAVPVGTYPSSSTLWPATLPNGSAVTSSNVAALYGGENNQGGFLSLFGIFPGATTANLGTTTKVKLGGAEPIYLYVGQAVTTANGFPAQIQRIDVQVGSAAVKALTLGTSVAVSVEINGVASNTTDLFGLPITFTPIQAPIFYVDETNGLDTNAGTYAAPLQHGQTYNGTTFGSAWQANGTVTNGVSNGVQAGTQLVYRGGTYSYITSMSSSCLNGFEVTGCSPTVTPPGGAAGVNTGPLTVTARATILGLEAVNYAAPTSAVGFIFGQDTTRAQSWPNPYYTSLGTSSPLYYGAKFIEISNISVIMNTNGTSTGQSPIYANNACDYWRVVNCELSTPSASATLDIKGGGIQGDSHGAYYVGNYIHDIHGNSQGTTTYENHGIYLDASIEWTSDTVVAFNHMVNCIGGSGIQIFSTLNPGTDRWGFTGMSGNTVAYNWVDTVQKYGLNMADGSLSAKVYENVVLNCNSYSLRFNVLNNTGCAFDIVNNTFYNGDESAGGGNAMITDEGNIAGGYAQFTGNVIVLGAAGSGRTSTGTTYFSRYGGTAASIYTWTDNQFYDPQGVQTGTAGFGTETGSVNGDPKFTTEFTDFSLATGSPCIGTGTTDANVSISYDFLLNPIIRSGQTSPSRGAYA